jgi:sulfur carrier protein ThiS
MSITVRVKLVSILKQYAPEPNPDGFEVTLPDQSQVKDLIQELGIPLKAVGPAMVNQQTLHGPRALQDGDQVLLLPPMVAGG